ncbi:BON domain-containing protein [Acidovorax sp. M2(2025)]|uniref:BON domain-containing protein n=1 Tax=Acidovorax sp. M2(2025) TaxID=3411355 RepID=UPI003BF4BD3C
MNNSNISLRPASRVAGILAVTAIALGLSACGKKEEPTVGQRLDSAVQKTEQAAADARAKAESAMKSAETKVEQGAASAESSLKSAADQGIVLLDDAGMTAKIKADLAKDPELSALKIDIETNNGRVTMKGPTPSEAARDRALAIAKAVTGVTSINNQLVVSGS